MRAHHSAIYLNIPAHVANASALIADVHNWRRCILCTPLFNYIILSITYGGTGALQHGFGQRDMLMELASN